MYNSGFKYLQLKIIRLAITTVIKYLSNIFFSRRVTDGPACSCEYASEVSVSSLQESASSTMSEVTLT